MNNRFVFVCPMYNASKYVKQMLLSVIGQSYDDWRLILIDDVSDPEEREAELDILTLFSQLVSRPNVAKNRIEVYWNDVKRWEVMNVLKGISLCDDDEIVCRIDADDYLCDLDALKFINEAYKQSDCDVLWTAHRWFDDRGTSNFNISASMPQSTDPYKHPWVSSHLKTFRKHLLNEVPWQNFLNFDGQPVKRAGDQAIYLPALHNSKRRIYVPCVTYAYRCDMSPATFQTADAKFQKAEADFVRSRGYVHSGEPWEAHV